MKTITSILFILLCAIQISFAQTFPNPGKDLVIRGAFFDKDKTIGTQTYQKNWNSDTQNLMTKDANNLFSFQLFLPWSQDGGTTPFTYKYTAVFKGEGTVGPRSTTSRRFTLTQDRIVNFYAKAWYNTSLLKYQTQMICDAQKVTFSFYTDGGMDPLTPVLPLPVNGKSAVVIVVPTTATGTVNYNVYTESDINTAPYAWNDLNNTLSQKQILCLGNKSGRYILMVDYTTVSSSTSKVLDGINTPLIKIGSGSLVDPSDVAFSGANLGTFNATTPLNISGSLNAYSTNNPVNVSDVSAKLYYQITKVGYDSGVKEVLLTNAGSTIQVGSVFANIAAKDITAGLNNGDYTLKVWYGTTNQTDVLLLDNSGSKYTATFSVDNTHTNGLVNWSSGAFSGSNMNIVVDDGELIIDENAEAESITVNPGAKLTLNLDKTLTVNSLLLLSDNVNGTASFVDKNNLTLQNITATVKQYLTKARNWYITSPVDAVLSSGITNATGGTLISYNEVDGSWPSAGTTMTVGKGYVAVSPTNSGDVSFSGVLNTGAKSFSLIRTDNAFAKRGFNLIGNPYPSYVNWQSAVRTNVGPTMWYRSKNDVANGGAYTFATYGAVSGVGTNVSGVNVTALIPPMQAFWVRVTEIGSGSVAFDNDMRAHAGATSKMLKTAAKVNTDQQVLRLQVSNGTNSDEAIILFNASASNGLDDFDSPKMTNANAAVPEIYTTVGKEQLVINGLNSIPVNAELPLGFTIGETNTYSIKATEFSNFEPGVKVFLKDKLLGTEQEITDGSAYSFASDVASNSTRFSVMFKSANVISELSNNSDQRVAIFKNANNQITVDCNGNLSEDASVTVYNSVGQKLVVKQITSSNMFITNVFKSGVYIVIVNNNGINTVQKVILN